jgi:phage terminase large subunit GpA-like protein
LKSELYGWLKQEIAEGGDIPPGYCHFPEYEQHYFKGITAEELQFKIDRKGFKVYEWVKKFERNEPLDCRVYARAAAAVVGIDRFADEHFDIISSVSGQEDKPKIRKSTFWNR